MKTSKYWLQYLAVVSLILITVSGIYDIVVGVKVSNWYLRWHTEHYGRMTVPSAVFNYALGLFRGTAVTFGCGLGGLAQIGKKRIRIGYLLFLAFWTAQYVLAVIDKAYKGIHADDAVQMLIAIFCLTILVVYKVLMGCRALE